MNALSYELKEVMPLLCQDDRWNVLTVLILFSNVRNRCWPSMDLIAKMGCNGNKARATRAKKWLVEHGAIELVKHSQRHEDEKHLPPRQHVYQLTGILAVKETGKSYHYLYTQDLKSFDGETFKSLPVENFDGETGSNTTSSKTKKDSTPVGVSPPKSMDEKPANKPDETKDENKAIGELIQAWLESQKIIDSKAYSKTGYRSVARDLYQAGITPEDVTQFIDARNHDAFWKDKTIPWNHIQANIATWKAKQNQHVTPKPVDPTQPVNVFDLMSNPS